MKTLIIKLLCFEWSPPWHFKTACWHHFCLKLLSRDFCPWKCLCPPQWLCHLFKLIASNFATRKVRSGIAPITLPHTCKFASNISHTCLTFFLTFFCTYFVPYLPTWGPAGNTWHGYSRLRSGREHWAWMVVVEVRQGTLGVDARGWGPAGNTGRGWSWLRSGREHLAWILAVEVWQGTLSMDGRGWGPTENTVDRGSQLDEEDEEDDEEEEEERRWGGEERRGGAGNWHKI